MKPGYLTLCMCFCAAFCAAALSAAQAQDGVAIVRGKGHGYVRYEGSGIFQITGGNGVLVVNQTLSSDGAPPAEVIFSSGEPYQHDEYLEPECLGTPGGGCAYRLLDARAWIRGEHLAVSFAGANIGLTASGDAVLTLKGYGMYRTGDVLGRWTLSGISITLQKE